MSAFKDVYLIHERGGSPNGGVLKLKHALVPLIPGGARFLRYNYPHSDPSRPIEESVAALRCLAPPINALLIGIGVGGQVAAAFQAERHDLSVIGMTPRLSSDSFQVIARLINDGLDAPHLVGRIPAGIYLRRSRW